VKLSRLRKIIVSVTCLFGLLLVGCNHDWTVPTETTTLPRPRPSASTCSAQCVFVDDARPLALALVQSDSSNTLALLAEFHATGKPGDRLSLAAQLSASLKAIAGTARLVVEVNGQRKNYLVKELPDSTEVFAFTTTSTVVVRYWLGRGALRAAPAAFRLTQVATGAVVTGASTPWHAQVTGSRLMSDEPYQVVTATGSDSTTSWLVTPFISGGPWGDDTFTSYGSFDASTPITITFSAPIAKAVIEILDPTYAGNVAVAYDSDSTKVDSVAFTYSGMGGVNIPDTDSLSGSIRKIVLTPADSDYVAYRLWITLTNKIKIVITYASGTPMGADGNPLIAPNGISTRERPVWDTTLTFTVKIDSMGRPRLNSYVHFSLDVADNAGLGSDGAFGHFHSSGTAKPKGVLVDSVSTGSSGTATVTYRAGQFSEPVTLRATGPLLDTVVKHWTVGISGFEALIPSTYLDTIGSIAIHPYNTYGRPSFNALIQALATWSYLNVKAQKMNINDMSLPWGGKFDYIGSSTWRTDTSHKEHRAGGSADIRVVSPTVFSKDQQKRIKQHWDSMPNSLMNYEGSPPHLHAKYWGTQ
jgi:hypothetical protein